ncbi:O-antigen ligase family protein [Arenibacter troitsensis]|uniref:O-antigen ligase like membrane protein n=1 Tax=Arenibacter troitsensis TaxID=188872 RepID=A0A1X7IXW1_9FLAO|nr:O-antigen ligase family protein [Arenibacter troitsensis]SMG20144.1 O-antigen ligase like membrane protein [Arenibacter troitsensis]
MKRLIFIIAFFVYSGFYAGLAILLSFNLSGVSRLYSVPTRVLIAFLMLIVIHQSRNRLIKNNNYHYLVLFTVFWVFYLIKTLYTEYFSKGYELGKTWYEYPMYALIYVVIPFLAFYTIDIEKYKKTIINGFISSGFLLGIASITLYGKYLMQGIGRLSMVRYQSNEEVLNPLILSYAGVLTIVLCIYKLMNLKRNNKFQIIYLSTNIVLSFIMFLLGSSRGSLIAIMLTIPIFISFSALKQKVKFITLSILSIPVIIWAMEASGSSLFERMGNTVEDKGGGRESLWKDAFAHFLDNPIFGGKIEIGGIYPHNFLLEIVMATGIIGLMLISPIFIKGIILIKNHTKKNKSYLFVLLLLIIGLIQHLFTGSIYMAILLFVPLGMIFGIQGNSFSDSSR